LLSAFPLLECVSIRRTYQYSLQAHPTGPPHPAAVQLPCLGVVKIGSRNEADVLKSLLLHESVLNVHTIHLDYICAVDTQSFGRFLRALGLALKHLQVRFGGYEGGQFFLHSFMRYKLNEPYLLGRCLLSGSRS
jgi:hypothetical protein